MPPIGKEIAIPVTVVHAYPNPARPKVTAVRRHTTVGINFVPKTVRKDRVAPEGV